MGYLGLRTRRVNSDRFQGVTTCVAYEQEGHLMNGVPFYDKSSAINPRRNRCNNSVDFERPVDMGEELGSAFEVLEPNWRGNRCESIWRTMTGSETVA